MVMVAPLFRPVASKMQVSWARGKKLGSGVAPDDTVHPLLDQFPPPAKFQYLFEAAVNVIPLLPLQSPTRVPDAGAAAPAMVMSRKSTSAMDTAAAVMVRVAPMVSLRTKVRPLALTPAGNVNVPFTVWLALSASCRKLAEPTDPKDRLLKVLAPLMVAVPTLVAVKLTL